MDSKLPGELRRQCGYYRLRERGLTNYPEEEHVRDCALCTAANELQELAEANEWLQRARRNLIASIRVLEIKLHREWKRHGD